MRRVILYIASSIDGNVAGENDDISWLYQATDGDKNDCGYAGFLSSIDTILIGRRTYDFVLQLAQEFPYKNKRCFVYTRDANFKGNEYVTVITQDLVTHVSELKKENGDDIWLLGGGQINTELLKAKLIDSMILTVHPVIVGSNAINLFVGKSVPKTNLALVSTTGYSNGLVQLTYNVKYD